MQSKRSERAHISLEIAHLYIYGIDNAEFVEHADAAKQTAEEWVLPLLNKWREKDGKTVVVKVLLDDYQTAYKKRKCVDRRFAIETLTKKLSSIGIDVDHVVFESAVANSAERMLSMIEPAPPRRDFQLTGPSKISFDESRSQIYFNFEPFPESDADWDELREEQEKIDPRKAQQLLNAVGTQVNLLFNHNSKRFWSCPSLSAWWQLLRLGLFTTKLVEDAKESEGIISFNEAAPLVAHRTFTVLPTQYIETEHAVRLLLKSIHLASQDRKAIGISEEDEDSLMLLKRVTSLFAN